MASVFILLAYNKCQGSYQVIHKPDFINLYYGEEGINNSLLQIG